ncbi:MAG: U32 family peptidase, partial [Betaproteobacteria bacterium HGW-Betaproteobacteria-8]
LENLANRGYTDGFYQRHHTIDHQNYMQGHSKSNLSLYVGDIIGYDTEHGLADIAVKNRFALGDRLQIIQPEGNREIVVESLFDKKGQPVSEAAGSGIFVRLPMAAGNFHNAMVARYL